MIRMIDVAKSYPTRVGRRIILHPTSLCIPTDRYVAVLGRNGAGKSTLLRMLAGVEPPDFGIVERHARLSWPIGSGGVNPKMTGRQNARFVADLAGYDPDAVEEFVEEFAELGAYMDETVSRYSSGMRSRLNFGMSLAVKFDCYLIDEGVSAGDQWFRDKCYAAFDERRKSSGLLMVSHNARMTRQYCDIGMVLHRGYLIPFDDLDEAIHFYMHGC